LKFESKLGEDRKRRENVTLIDNFINAMMQHNLRKNFIEAPHKKWRRKSIKVVIIAAVAVKERQKKCNKCV
jgi:hypothetical protein